MRPRGKVLLGTHWSVPYNESLAVINVLLVLFSYPCSSVFIRKTGDRQMRPRGKVRLGTHYNVPIMWQIERVREGRVGGPPHITGQWYGYGKGKPSGQSRPALRRGSQRSPRTDRGQGAGMGAFARKEADWRRHPSPSGGPPGFPCASGGCPTIPKGPPHRLSRRSRIRTADCRPSMTLY